jgi:diacylglycerol kinase family enzyme
VWPPLASFLLIDPRSGKGSPTADELAAEARAAGVQTHVLQKGEDPAVLARDSTGDVLGMDERLFLNNVSLGVYARLVHRREAQRRRREAFARIRAWGILLAHRQPLGISIDGDVIEARLVLVANNAYVLELPSLGERERLDEGKLHVYSPGAEPPQRVGERFVVDAAEHRLEAAIDGEPDVLQTPVAFRVEPGALRVLVPPAESG